MTEITELMPDDIVVRDRLRGLNPDVVERLKESIRSIGFKTPLSVRFLSDDEGYQLVTGRHRLQAAIDLELEWVPVREEMGSELDAKLWEIAENLHRAELTTLERDEHIAEWIKLVEERDKEQLLQVATKAPVGHRPESGVRAAARGLGIESTEAHRAVKIGSLAPEAKAEAISLGLDDNQSALLKAAKQPTKEEQIRALREHAAQRNQPRAKESPAASSPVSPGESAVPVEADHELASPTQAAAQAPVGAEADTREDGIAGVTEITASFLAGETAAMTPNAPLPSLALRPPGCPADMVAYYIKPGDPMSGFSNGLAILMAAVEQFTAIERAQIEVARQYPSDQPLYPDDLTKFVTWMMDFDEVWRRLHPRGNEAARSEEAVG